MATTRASHAAARTKNHVTSGQLAELHSQIKRRQITRDSMQAFLLMHGDFRSYLVGEYSPKNFKREQQAIALLLKEWDSQLVDPRQPRPAGWISEDIMYDADNRYGFAGRLVEAFLMSQTDVKLQPTIDDYPAYCRFGVFWRPRHITEVHIVTDTELRSVADNPEHELFQTLEGLNNDVDVTDGLDYSQGQLSILEDHLKYHFAESLDAIADDVDALVDFKTKYGEEAYDELNDWRFTIGIMSRRALATMVMAWALLRLHGREETARCLEPLLYLGFQGNIPLGVDSQDRLIVLCKSE